MNNLITAGCRVLCLAGECSNNNTKSEIKMKKNKLVIAMAAITLMNSMGAMAAKEDSFDINYNVQDQITIDITGDINLSDSNAVDSNFPMQNIRGSTTFCVGMVGAAALSPEKYTLAASSIDNSSQLDNAGNKLSYNLKYKTEDNSTPIDSGYDSAADIDLGGDPYRDNSTAISLASCTTGSSRNGRIWVNIEDTTGAVTTGTYTDTVTLTVAVQ